jgi:hypothetical protein
MLPARSGRRLTAASTFPETGCRPSDDHTSVAYLHDEGLRTNVLHLPIRSNRDGGIFTTAADVHAPWDAKFAGRIVSPDTVAERTRPRSDVPELAPST